MTDSLWITNDLVALSGWCELLNFLSTLHAWFLLKISSSASFRSPLFNREELLPISISLLCTQLGSSTAFLQFVKRSVHLFLPFTFILDRLSWLGYANDFKKHFLNSYVNLLYILSPQKLSNISLRIQQIETTLCILEAKVRSLVSSVILWAVYDMSCIDEWMNQIL